jgi:hypothetical protein
VQECPILGKVPSFFDKLLLKTSVTGVTLLKQNRYKSRYIGSKYAAIDINGNLYKRAGELKEVILSADSEGKKKGRLKRPPGKTIKALSEMQISDNFSTSPPELSPNEAAVIPSLPVKGYKVNKREVRSRILGYINTIKGKKELYFWTVTFPMGTPDAKCYQIFNIWLTSLRKYKMLREYLWIAERQPLKTHTIHFHIAIPHKMPVQRANAMMRGTLKTFARRGEIPYTVQQCPKYNGVDIHKNRKTKRVINFAIRKGARALAGYLTKYLTKNDTCFSHLAWHNSRGFSALFTAITFTIAEFKSHGFGFFLNRRDVKDMEFAKFIPWLGEPPPQWEIHLYKLNSYLQLNPN